MKKLRVLFVAWALFCGCFAPARVYAGGRLPVRLARQSPKAVVSLDRQALRSIQQAAVVPLLRPIPAVKAVTPAVLNPAISQSAASIVPLISAPALSSPGLRPFTLSSPVAFPGKEAADAVIFDLDGTLLDSLFAWEHSGTNFLRTQGITPPEGLDERLAQMSLMDGARLIKEMFSLPQEPEELLRLTLEPIRRHYLEDIPAKPGVPETLRRLKLQGVKLCVATASDGELARAALARLELLDLFDFVLTCDEVGVGKRDPRVYEEALRRLGTEKSRTLVAEDAPYALQTAHRAGFGTVGVADPHTPADGVRQILEQADYYVSDYLNGVFKK